MGSYGIGPARIAAAAVEQRHDADGIVWPWAIAPFHVHLVPVAVKDAAQMAAAEEIYRELRAAGFDVLMDDREERAGVKFKDADLLGIPIRVTVGNALAKEGVVEVRQRSTRAGPPGTQGRGGRDGPGDGANDFISRRALRAACTACGGPFPVLKS